MAKTELTKRIEARLSSYRPKELGDYKLNYHRDQYDMYEVPVTHGYIQDGLVDYVWLAEGFTNIRQEPYCIAPKYANSVWGVSSHNCEYTSDDFKVMQNKSPIISNACNECRYKSYMVKQDDTPAVICFEIKVSKADFHSNHGHNFIGNLNYYVMPLELYKEVADEIPSEIGCIAFSASDKQDVLRKRKDAIWREIDKDLYSSLLLTALNKYRKDWSHTTYEQRAKNDAYYSIIDSLLHENTLMKRDITERPSCFKAPVVKDYMNRNSNWYLMELSTCSEEHGPQSVCEECIFHCNYLRNKKKHMGLYSDNKYFIE